MSQPEGAGPASPPSNMRPPPSPPYPPPPSAVQSPPPPAVSRVRHRRSMATRRIGCTLLALVATPFGIWWSVEGGLGVAEENTLEGESGGDPIYFVFMLVGLVLLAVVAASGRFSAVGPLVAALVWGVGPVLVHALAPDLFTRISGELDEVVGEWFEEYALVIFPVVAALMLGAAIAARGTRRRT